MMIGMNLTIDRIGLDIKGDNLQRISMHIKGIALRKVDSHRRVRR